MHATRTLELQGRLRVQVDPCMDKLLHGIDHVLFLEVHGVDIKFKILYCDVVAEGTRPQ